MEHRFAKRAEGISSSAIREIFKHLGRPGLISFAGGNPGAFALPDAQVAKISSDVLAEQGKAVLQYGQTEGWMQLRKAFVPYVEDTFAKPVNLQQVIITTGSMQGLDLLLRTLVNTDDVVLCESPTFLGALQALGSTQAHVVPVPCDEQGMNVTALENLMQQYRPKLLYTIPTFQNPTGRTLSVQRRQRVAQLANKYQVFVAEDDPYLQLRYQGEHLPSIASFDTEGWVTILGSFSKVLSPGLRVGFMAGNPVLLSKCVQFKQCTDVHTANLNQAIAARFLSEHMLWPHLKHIIPLYRRNLEVMLEQLASIPQVASYTKPEGGFFVFVTLADGIDTELLFQQCLEEGLAFVPGASFYPQEAPSNTLRLNFSNATPDTIHQGMRIFARCLEQYKGG